MLKKDQIYFSFVYLAITFVFTKMAGTFWNCHIRSWNFFWSFLIPNPMTYQKRSKKFKKVIFMTHPTTHALKFTVHKTKMIPRGSFGSFILFHSEDFAWWVNFWISQYLHGLLEIFLVSLLSFYDFLDFPETYQMFWDFFGILVQNLSRAVFFYLWVSPSVISQEIFLYPT